MVAVISLVLPSMLSPHLTTEAAFEVLKSYPQKTKHDHILSYSHFIEILETKSWAKKKNFQTFQVQKGLRDNLPVSLGFFLQYSPGVS